MQFFETAQHQLHFLVMLHIEEVIENFYLFLKDQMLISSATKSFIQSISSDVDGFFLMPGVSLIFKNELRA